MPHSCPGRQGAGMRAVAAASGCLATRNPQRGMFLFVGLFHPLRWRQYPLTRGGENPQCAQTRPRAAESGPFPASSQAIGRLLESAQESRNWSFHCRQHVMPTDFQLCPPGPAPAAILVRGSVLEMVFWAEMRGMLLLASVWAPLEPGA